jgi:hypothetical protein
MRFLYFSHAILALFMGIIITVIVIAYSRRSGTTGMDMAGIQKMRYETVLKDSTPSLTREVP